MAKKTWAGTTDSVYATDTNWLEASKPTTGEAVWLQGSVAITGEDQSAVAVDELLDQLSANMGSTTTYMQIDPNSMEVNYSGSSAVHYLDIGSAAISPTIKETAKPSATYGMYLLGSAMATITMFDGSVAVAGLLDETATVATVRVHSGTLYLGPGVSLTTLYILGGNVVQECASTTTTIQSGTLTTRGTGAITTLNVEGGSVTLDSTGTVTTLAHSNGSVDATGKGFAKTITNYTPTVSGNPIMKANDALVTVTNYNKPTGTYSVSHSSA